MQKIVSDFFLSGMRKLIFLFELFKSFKNSLFPVYLLLRETTTKNFKT